MSYNFQNSGANSFGAYQNTPAQTNNGSNSQIQAQNGPDLQDIQTESIGFQAICGDAKVQLLSTPWPSDNLPRPTSNLLGIASRRGILAAAGPDSIILDYTENVRKAFEAPGGKIKPFEPRLRLPMTMRISQLVFSADEEFLIISAEIGGGLAIYEVQALLNGNQETAFQIPTNNEGIRALVPNPAIEKGEMIAVITTEGKLMVADLKQKNFISGPNNSPILKEGVSCVSWSKLGKQLVAGLVDGTSYQLTPEGVGKAEIPRPPSLTGDYHVSQILWLETTVFFTVHTPTSHDNSDAPASEFHIVTKQSPPKAQPASFGQPAPQQSQTTTYVFQKVNEPVGPYGLNRSPPHHFILRLKEFPPDLQDLLIVASSASGDIGLLSRCAKSLERDKDTANVFTNTEPSDDARRAALPLGADGSSDTSPIGVALDLSAKDPIIRPLPLDDEINKSDGPVPGLMVLSNEGVLASWWVVYSDSIRQKTTYPGIVSQAAAQPATQPPPVQQQSTFASNATQSTFGAPSLFGGGSDAAAPAFGAAMGMGPKASPWAPANSTPATSAPAAPAFGSSAFGAGAGMGPKASPWATTNSTPAASASAAPKFGSSTFGAPSLPSALAAPAKPFGSTSLAPGSAPAFGQAATFGSAAALTGAKPSVWGSPSTTNSSAAPAAPASGGFAVFANKGGFAAAAPPSSGSVFGSKTQSGGGVFGSTSSSDGPSAFAGGSSTFGQPEEKPKSIFGGGNSTFGQPEEKPKSIFGGGNSTFGQPEETPKSIFGGGNDQPTGMTVDSPTTQNKPLFQRDNSFGANSSSSKTTDTKLEQRGGGNPFPQNKIGGLFGTGPVNATTTTPEKDDKPRPTSSDSKSFFGSTFGDALSGSPTPTADKAPWVPISGEDGDSTTPSATPVAPKFELGNAASKTGENKGFGGLFGDKANKAAEPSSTNSGFLSGMKAPATTPSSPLASIFAKKESEPVAAAQSIFGGSKPSYSKTAAEADAPLPPDFSTLPKSAAGDAPLPPDFSTLPKSAATDAPLPPDFSKPPVKADIGDKLPPVPLAENSEDSDVQETGDETYSLQSDDEDDDEEREFSEEGSGEDVTKDLSPVSDSNKTLGHTPQSSFGDRTVKKGPSDLFSSMEKPAQSSSKKILFGEINFPPPARPTSPRSPSPVRSAVPGRMRPEASRSVSTPVTGPGSASTSRAQPALPARPSFSAEQKIAEDAERAKAKAEKEARENEEAQAMIDHEDNLAQKQLNAPIIPTTVLDEFIAHQDYIGSVDRTGIPAQVETVYRDINSMIDTLGMNTRALKAFIVGHAKGKKVGGRSKEDLETDDGWVLVEIENLTSIIEQDLRKELEENRIQDLPNKLQECQDLRVEATRLKQKHEDIKQLVAEKADPDQRESALAAPLSKEQALMQFEIRKKFREFQELLIKAEEELTVLKAKLVSKGGKGNGNAVPTIEAIMRTINKMMAMAERKSGDVDVLEDELRKMSLGASRGPGSREGSPFAASVRSPPLGESIYRTSTATRTPLRSSMANSHNSMRFSGMYQTPDTFHTPPTTNRGFGMSASVLSRSRGSLGSSMRSSVFGSPAKLTMENVPDEAMLRMSAKMARKKAVAEQLRTALGRVAPRIVGMDDE